MLELIQHRRRDAVKFAWRSVAAALAASLFVGRSKRRRGAALQSDKKIRIPAVESLEVRKRTKALSYFPSCSESLC